MRYVVCIKRSVYNPLTFSAGTVVPSNSDAFRAEMVQAYEYNRPEVPSKRFMNQVYLHKDYPPNEWIFLDFETDIEAWNVASPPDFIRARADL